MEIIRLARGQWGFNESAPLGPPGGFGEVFRGTGPDGPVAVKRLKLTAGAAAFRELRMGEVLGERKLTNVVPILDCGQDADSDRYFLVMPICERSLQEKIGSGVPIETQELCEIAMNIVSGLIEVKDIVHRDLKPGNVLFLEGCWRLADFGIAKFVEDSTSLETLRECLTPRYAAPEQWRGERPTHATDVYSLGCITYEMATGANVFKDAPDIRDAHLHVLAPAVVHKSAKLAAFVSQMLRKSPEARPNLARCFEVFKDVASGSSSNIHPVLARISQAAS